ncbi:hypothetical protein RJ640_016787 [Escallonia rubra]|uniref:Protein TIC 20 n=1 Tax=Escallonia rubra TaxID=112253 RepID=A0AA88U770_9ASTE|nr:hypothetical protein RJ640_016787 [Escallonia rubra]
MASIPLLRLSLPPQKALTTKTHHHHRPISAHLPSPIPHPLKSTLHIPSLHHLQRPRPSPISASYNPTPVTDRLISAAAYFLPFFNGLQYGRFLLAQYPRILGPALEPILPLLSLYRSLPYASFVAFFALYLGVVRNPSLSRYVRFNAMQALVLDVLLVVPLLVQRILDPGRAGVGFKLMVMGHNAIFVFLVMCFVYSLVYSILGKTPYLPFVADAAGRQF